MDSFVMLVWRQVTLNNAASLEAFYKFYGMYFEKAWIRRNITGEKFQVLVRDNLYILEFCKLTALDCEVRFSVNESVEKVEILPVTRHQLAREAILFSATWQPNSLANWWPRYTFGIKDLLLLFFYEHKRNKHYHSAAHRKKIRFLLGITSFALYTLKFFLASLKSYRPQWNVRNTQSFRPIFF